MCYHIYLAAMINIFQYTYTAAVEVRIVHAKPDYLLGGGGGGLGDFRYQTGMYLVLDI